MDDQNNWLGKKELEEKWECRREEMIEYDYEFIKRSDKYYWTVIEKIESFHYKELAGLWGHPPGKKGS